MARAIVVLNDGDTFDGIEGCAVSGQRCYLSDGDTFSSVDGCSIHDVPDDWETDDIEHYLRDLRFGRSEVFYNRNVTGNDFRNAIREANGFYTKN